MVNNLSQKTAQELAVLQNNQLNMLLCGDMTMDQVEWFQSLTFEQREQFLIIKPVVKSTVEPCSTAIIRENDAEISTLSQLRQSVIIKSKVDETAHNVISRVSKKDPQVSSSTMPPKASSLDTPVLRLLSEGTTITIKAFDFGQSDEESAYDIFSALFFKDCIKLESNKTPDTPKAKVDVLVYEISKNSSYRVMFDSLGIGLGRLCFTREQIRNFCLKHYNWLNQEGFPSFFLFRDGKDFFVARILLDDGDMKIFEDPIDSEGDWSAGNSRRVIVPYLNSRTFP